MSRARMPAAERGLRSRLAQAVRREPMIRGTLCVRKITCGKASCRCARGDKHLALYISCSVEGKSRQMFVPRSLERELRQWVANYHRVQELLEQLSEQSGDELKARKEKGRL